MVEFALVAPAFLLMLFGAIEMGLLFKTRGAYQEAALQGVRIAAAAATATDADKQALAQLSYTLSAENLANIASVTVYDATASGAPFAPIPSNGAVTGTFYTVYTYNPSYGFVCPGTNTPPPCPSASSWNPATRNALVPTLDHVGVRIIYKYRALGIIPSLTMTQVATALIEPRSYGS